MGVEYQHVKFSTLQPAWSRGAFDYNGNFTDIPNQGSTDTAAWPRCCCLPWRRRQRLPAIRIPNGFSYSGGADNVYASNINKTYDEKMYFATYFQDDWKMTPKLTINLGLRWDYFGPINETNGGQANFVPDRVPAKGLARRRSSFRPPERQSNAVDRRATCSGIGLLSASSICWRRTGSLCDETNKYGQGLLADAENQLCSSRWRSPTRSPEVVARGGFGLFYNSFENQGYGPNIGENYPFVFNLNYGIHANPADPQHRLPGGAGQLQHPIRRLRHGGSGRNRIVRIRLLLHPAHTHAVNALGLGSAGSAVRLQTPTHYSANVTAPVLHHAYAFGDGVVCVHPRRESAGRRRLSERDADPACRHQHWKGCPYATFAENSCVPFVDFGGGSYQATYGVSSYHGLQTKLEQQFSNGLTFLLTYTWSKTLSDAGDLLNGGSTGGLRAYNVPDLGHIFDYARADFDLRNVIHFSGGYELPFGKGKKYMNQGGVANAILGGWATNWIVTLQGGQPINFTCHSATTSGAGQCNDILLPGAELRSLESRSRLRADTTGRSGSEIRQPSAGVPVRRPGLTSNRRIGAGLRAIERRSGLGQQAGTDLRTGIPSLRLLAVQELPDQRAVLAAVPVGVLQHPQPSELQRTELRRQRRGRGRRFG